MEVELVRMHSELIADKRRLFELFTTLKDRAIGKYPCVSSDCCSVRLLSCCAQLLTCPNNFKHSGQGQSCC